MSDQIYLDDLGDFELIAFNSNMGVAANSKSNKLIIFERISREWSRSCYDLSDVSRIENISMSPKTLHGFGGGGLRGAGQSLGIGALNALHKSKAKRQTGIKIHLRSLSIRAKFLNVPMDQQRVEIVEALSQFLDGGSVSGQMYQVPLHVRRALERPTEDETRRDIK